MSDQYPFLDWDFRVKTLEAIRLAMQQRVSAEMLESIDIGQRPAFEDALMRQIVLAVEYAVLAEKLPPQSATHLIERQHPEAVGELFLLTDPRWATWRDHFWASHRRLAKLFRRTPRTVDTIIRQRATMPVTCKHGVTLDIRDMWTYPSARTTLPGFGQPILRHERTDSRSMNLFELGPLS